MVIALSHKSYLFASIDNQFALFSIRAAVLAVVAKRAGVLPAL